MPEFHVRSDSVNVEQIMEQIRARISEKRGVDYTEQQIREMAAVKLEKFLDPGGLRSDLLEQFRRVRNDSPPAAPPNYAFEDQTLFESHRAPLRWIRGLLRPLLKLFFNPNPLIQALHIQSQVNNIHAEREVRREAARRGLDQLQYEMLHNLVVETTRISIEVKNLKMRVESLTSRLEFNERRARALESVVAYKPAVEDRPALDRVVDRVADRMPDRVPDRVPDVLPDSTPTDAAPAATPLAPGPGQRSRRRRRRRGRRGDGPAAAIMGGGFAQPMQGGAPSGQPDESGVKSPESAGEPGPPPESLFSDSTPDDSDPDQQ